MAHYFNNQEIDARPGNYYVSIIDGPKKMLALGPFPRHMGALMQVEAVRTKAQELDTWASFYGFGTARIPLEETAPNGKLNHILT